MVKWLQSLNPEVATYDYLGLKYLVQYEIDIPETWFTRMSEMNKSEIQLNTCDGCIYGVTKRISAVLKEKNLKQIYRSFKENGWLK